MIDDDILFCYVIHRFADMYKYIKIDKKVDHDLFINDNYVKAGDELACDLDFYSNDYFYKQMYIRIKINKDYVDNYDDWTSIDVILTVIYLSLDYRKLTG